MKTNVDDDCSDSVELHVPRLNRGPKGFGKLTRSYLSIFFCSSLFLFYFFDFEIR